MMVKLYVDSQTWLVDMFVHTRRYKIWRNHILLLSNVTELFDNSQFINFWSIILL